MHKIAKIIICFVFLTALSCAENRTGITEQFYSEPGDSGLIILKSLSIKDGRMSFLTETSGCTNKQSFKVNVETSMDKTKKVQEYTLTIVKVVPDRCKAFIMEGIVIEYDLNKDLGINENAAVSVKNMVLSR